MVKAIHSFANRERLLNPWGDELRILKIRTSPASERLANVSLIIGRTWKS